MNKSSLWFCPISIARDREEDCLFSGATEGLYFLFGNTDDQFTMVSKTIGKELLSGLKLDIR